MLMFRAHKDNSSLAISPGCFVGKLFDGYNFLDYNGSGFYKIEPYFNARTPVLKFRLYFDSRDSKTPIGALKDFDSFHEAILFANDRHDLYQKVRLL